MPSAADDPGPVDAPAATLRGKFHVASRASHRRQRNTALFTPPPGADAGGVASVGTTSHPHSARSVADSAAAGAMLRLGAGSGLTRG